MCSVTKLNYRKKLKYWFVYSRERVVGEMLAGRKRREISIKMGGINSRDVLHLIIIHFICNH